MARTAYFSVENGVLKEKYESAQGSYVYPLKLVSDSIEFPVTGGGSSPSMPTMELIPRVSGSGFSGVWKKTIRGQTITITLSENAYKTEIVDASFSNQRSLTTIAVYEGSLDTASASGGSTRNFTVNRLLGYSESFYTVVGDKLTITKSDGSLSYTKQ